MGATAATPMLLLPAAFLAGLLIAWLLMRRHQATMVEQLERLRADRRRLSQKLLIAKDRLRERRALANRLSHDNARLLRTQDRLESEHAELAVRYANVRLTGSGERAQAEPPDLTPATNPLGAGFSQGLQPSAKAFAETAIGRLAARSEPTADESHQELAAEDWVANTEPADWRAQQPPSVEVPLTDLGPESLSEPGLTSPIEAQTSIELVSTRFAETLVKFGDRRQPVRQQAIRTLKEMEPDLLSTSPLSEKINDLPHELMLQLAEQDDEIERLKAQLVPLMGLPLVVTAREAERDRLARQLKDRDAKIAALRSELERLHNDSVSTLRGIPTVTSLTASEPTGPHYPPMPDQVDNLKRIRGIGPVLERMLNRLGIYQYRQIATWTTEDVRYFDEQLKDFRGRIERDEWVANARLQHRSKYGVAVE